MKNKVEYIIKVSNKNDSFELHSSNDIVEIAVICRNLHDASKRHIVKKETRYQLVMKRNDGEHTLCDSKKLMDLALASGCINYWNNKDKPEKDYSKVSDFPADWLTIEKFTPFWTNIKKSVA